MEPPALLQFPNVSLDRTEHDLVEIDAAIALVDRGFATRVQLLGLMDAEAAAAIGLAHAQQANVGFSLARRPDGGSILIVGPRN